MASRRTSTLSRHDLHPHGSNLTLAQDTEQDYYMHIHRARYKDEARKQRFNLQTFMLIGCYTMLVRALLDGMDGTSCHTHSRSHSPHIHTH